MNNIGCQVCSIIMESFAYTQGELLFEWGPPGLEFASGIKVPEFRLQGISKSSFCKIHTGKYVEVGMFRLYDGEMYESQRQIHMYRRKTHSMASIWIIFLPVFYSNNTYCYAQANSHFGSEEPNNLGLRFFLIG